MIRNVIEVIIMVVNFDVLDIINGSMQPYIACGQSSFGFLKFKL